MEIPSIALVKPSWIRYQALGWTCALSMVTYIDRVCIKQVQPEMSGALGLTDHQFSWVFAAFGLAYALFEVPSGWLGDRFGPRRVLCRIVLWWSAFTALTGLVWPFSWSLGWFVFDSFLLLLLIRFLFGAGEAGAYPNITRALRNWFPYERRGLSQGLLWMCARWGGAIAPLLIGFLSLRLGWRGAFVALGLLGVFWVIAFALFFRDHPEQHPRVNEAELALIRGAAGEQTKAPPLSWPKMLLSPTLWCLSLMYFCSNAGWCFFITWDVKYYRMELGLTEGALAVASGAPLFFGGIACLGGGLVTDRLVRALGRRWGRTAQGAVAYICGGLFFTLALMSGNSPWLAVGFLCCASFLKDFAMAVSWSTCIDIGQRYSGTVAGVMNMVGNMGTFFSPPIVAYLANPDPQTPPNWGVALSYSAIMFFIAALGWLFINPRRVIVY